MFESNLFSLLREGFRELTITGEVVVFDGDKVCFQSLENPNAFPARSLLKPFQFLATELPEAKWTGKKEDNPYAAALGSISANKKQVSEIEKWEPKRLELKEHLALASLNYPMDEGHRALLKEQQAQLRPEFHSCFSKHLSIVEACDEHGWDKKSYAKESHPFHKNLCKVLTELLEADISETVWVPDGCGLPSPVLTMAQMAKLFQKLANADAGHSLGKIKEIMLSNPYWVGGPKRVDTRLMEENSGKIIAKEGADGLLGVSILPSNRHPKGLGIVIKVYSGYQPFMAALALQPILEALQLKGVARPPAGQTVKYHFVPFTDKKSYLDISPPLSAQSAVFPGDVPYERSVSMDTQKGDHLTLSSFKTTLHIGAHTDAPNHFSKEGPGIDEVDIQKYFGPCQVIQVKKSKGSVIEAEDVGAIRAKRVLFKTQTFEDPNHFNTDFVALSEGAIEKLAKQGAVLVGIDTPSIDPSESKTLPAHHATLRAEMAILEGIDLKEVEEGTYWLNSIPLKIKGGDASPVRAVLMSDRC